MAWWGWSEIPTTRQGMDGGLRNARLWDYLAFRLAPRPSVPQSSHRAPRSPPSGQLPSGHTPGISRLEYQLRGNRIYTAQAKCSRLP